jgi:hypothetical protein
MAQLKSFSMLPLCLLVSLTFWLSSAIPDSNNTPVFTQALESFKQSDFAKSREGFLQLLQQFPNDPVLLYNAGLVEMSDQHPGRAAAYWRKALFIKPGFSPAIVGINQLESQKNPAVIPLPWWQKGSRYVSLSFLLSTLLVSIALSVFFGVRKLRAIKLELPPRSTAPLLFFSAFSVFLVGVIAVHVTAVHWHTSATVMAAVSIHSSPNTASPALFDFKEGDEVIIHRRNGEWLQVQRGSTALGWVQKDAVFIHSGPDLLPSSSTH